MNMNLLPAEKPGNLMRNSRACCVTVAQLEINIIIVAVLIIAVRVTFAQVLACFP